MCALVRETCTSSDVGSANIPSMEPFFHQELILRIVDISWWESVYIGQLIRLSNIIYIFIRRFRFRDFVMCVVSAALN